MSIFELKPLQIPQEQLSKTEHVMYTSLQEIHYLVAKLYGAIVLATTVIGIGGAIFAFFFVRSLDEYVENTKKANEVAIQVSTNSSNIRANEMAIKTNIETLLVIRKFLITKEGQDPAPEKLGD